MDPTSRELLASVAARDQAAEQALYERFAWRLLGLAHTLVDSRLASRASGEDVVQSALASFFRAARSGRFEVHEPGELWKLLAAIVRHKARHTVERETAAKRHPGREVLAGEIPARQASPADVVALRESLRQALRELSPEDRRIVELRLDDQDAWQIAAVLQSSPRTVRRKLLALRQHFARRFGDEAWSEHVSGLPRPTFDDVAPLDFRNYQLEQIAGAGGFGKVYQAFDRLRGEIVAVKVLRKQFLLLRTVVAQFIREAEVIRQLDHPHIIRLHGLGRHPSGGPFLVLDWHGEGTLETHATTSIRQALSLLCQTATAIAHAHQRGVIHGDLKPSNILISSQGNAVVTDFGFALAARAAVRGDIYVPGGTPGYLAPELWSSSAPTTASDVFALGGVLRKVLARFPADSNRCEVHSIVENLTKRCQADQPTIRPTAAALATELASMLHESARIQD